MFEHKSFLQFIDQCYAKQEDIVCLSIVKTEGSTYRKAGATMLVSSSHKSIGVLSGGCIEEAMLYCCDEVLHVKHGKLVTHDLRLPDDRIESWEEGVGCNGLIQVWLEPFYAKNSYGALGEAAHYAQKGVKKTLIRSTKTEKFGEYRLIDSISDTPILYNEEDQFILQNIKPVYKLLILGVGSAAQALVDMANVLGWETLVCDTRKDHLDAIFNTDKQWLAESGHIENILVPQSFNGAVIMSHDFKDDAVYLKALSHSNIAYVGLLGARKRTQKIMEILEKQSICLDDRFHAPIGLDIGAQSPQSIALSICAEIEAKKNKRPGTFLRTKKGILSHVLGYYCTCRR